LFISKRGKGRNLPIIKKNGNPGNLSAFWGLPNERLIMAVKINSKYSKQFRLVHRVIGLNFRPNI
jgi:hypothetical protein